MWGGTGHGNSSRTGVEPSCKHPTEGLTRRWMQMALGKDIEQWVSHPRYAMSHQTRTSTRCQIWIWKWLMGTRDDDGVERSPQLTPISSRMGRYSRGMAISGLQTNLATTSSLPHRGLSSGCVAYPSRSPPFSSLIRFMRASTLPSRDSTLPFTTPRLSSRLFSTLSIAVLSSVSVLLVAFCSFSRPSRVPSNSAADACRADSVRRRFNRCGM